MKELGDQELERDREEAGDEQFKHGLDICRQLMERYAKSSAPQHRHLLATAAAMRSILEAEELPLTPPAYFAAAISAIENACGSQLLDLSAVSALSSFLVISLPLVMPSEIPASKAGEAVGILARLLEREGLAVSSVRAVVKSLSILVGFCDLRDWESVKLGVEMLFKFSIDRRPKVRRSAQDCLEKHFKTFQCSDVAKEASKLVLSLLKRHVSVAIELSTVSTEDGSKDHDLSKPEYLEVLYMLNVLTLCMPFLSKKILLKVVKTVRDLITPHFSAITRHIFKIIGAAFESTKVEVIFPEIEGIIESLGLFVSSGDKNPLDTLMIASTLLKHAMEILNEKEPSSGIRNLPLVCGYMGGLLTKDEGVASHVSSVLRHLINSFIKKEHLPNLEGGPVQDCDKESMEAMAIKSTCHIFHNMLSNYDGVSNQHILEVISALFLQLGETSFLFMKNTVLRLVDLMNLERVNIPTTTDHIQSCLGSAVIAMGPEMILTIAPISFNADECTYRNMWLVSILKKYVVGASLGYYLEHIVPLAKRFQQDFRKVKKSTIGSDVQAFPQELFKLLPAFCRQTTDMDQFMQTLSGLIISFLKKDPFMHEDIAIALKILVEQNKVVLNPKNDAGESISYAVEESVQEIRNVASYTKETALINIDALASASAELLNALTDLFVGSTPPKRSFLKGGIRCLASITDSEISKNIFLSLFKRFKFVNEDGEFEEVGGNLDQLIDKDQSIQSNVEEYVQRCVILDLASSFVDGAKEDLIDLIYSFIKNTFMASNGFDHKEAYQTLSRILEEHAWFCSSRFVELVDLLLHLSPSNVESQRSRFASFHLLMVHSLKISSEVENTKAFLMLNEIIVNLKDIVNILKLIDNAKTTFDLRWPKDLVSEAKEEASRKAAYDVLLDISSSLKNSSSTSSDSLYREFVTMIMGYLSGASPHIKSGAISALSVLLYNDVEICLLVPELVPSLLVLLQGKALEVIKAVLGFVKVLVSRLQAKELQKFLSEIVNSILPWSSVSKHHFRSKVALLLEIIIRKCGSVSVHSVTPEKYKNFVKTVPQSRHKKKKEDDATNTVATMPDSSTERLEERKQGPLPAKTGLAGPTKRRRTNKSDSESLRSNKKPRTFNKDVGGFKKAETPRPFYNQSQRSRNKTRGHENMSKRSKDPVHTPVTDPQLKTKKPRR